GRTAAPIPTALFACRRADPRAADGAPVIGLGEQWALCETSSSWRLLFCEAPLPRASHHSFYTSSEEPPLSIFNSYWDIPPGVERAITRQYPTLKNSGRA